jgi:GNAT superfamily N-acetyltransferase
MADPVVVRRVQTRAEFRIFLKFPWTLYKDDPCWVPPLVSEHRYKLDRKRSPTWRHMAGDYFIAWRGEQPVGTICAFINYQHNEFYKERAGFFGQFEAYNDQAAASALLQAAAHYLEARGCVVMRGPANFSINDEYGILVKGFDDPPTLVMPYNPPYYRSLIEKTPGFNGGINMVSYNITLRKSEESGKLDQTFRVVRRNNTRRGITARTLDRKQIDRDLQIVKQIYNSIWDNNLGFVPLSEQELDWMIRDMKRYLDPRLMIFAEVQGEPAGFLMALPDLNQPLHAAYPRPGKPDLLSKAQVLWYRKMRSKINRIRLPLMGVKEEFRGIGVEAAMFLKLYEIGVEIGEETGWEVAEAGWVLETNEPMQRLVEAYNAEPCKQYRFYERALHPAAEAEYPARPPDQRAPYRRPISAAQRVQTARRQFVARRARLRSGLKRRPVIKLLRVKPIKVPKPKMPKVPKVPKVAHVPKVLRGSISAQRSKRTKMPKDKTGPKIQLKFLQQQVNLRRKKPAPDASAPVRENRFKR